MAAAPMPLSIPDPSEYVFMSTWAILTTSIALGMDTGTWIGNWGAPFWPESYWMHVLKFFWLNAEGVHDLVHWSSVPLDVSACHPDDMLC